MDFLLDVINSTGLGAIVGGIFGWLGKKEERRNIKMKLDHDLNMIKAKTDHAVSIAKMTMEQAEVAGRLAVEKVEASAFKESQKTSSKWAENIKSMIRPIILSILFYHVYRILSELLPMIPSMTLEEKQELLKISIVSILGLTSTAVGWYYAARSSKQFDKLIDKWGV